MLSKLSTLILLSAAVAAVPARTVEQTIPWTWDVSQFTSTCTAATCRYDFNVSGAIGPDGQPSFNAYGCIGTSAHGEYKGCSTVGLDVLGNVLAQEFNSGRDIGAIISVQYTFLQDGLVYAYTGNNTVAHTNGGEPFGFTIVPTKASVVIPDKA
ncbi:hypothetical protein K505DRAFT_253255 [Melanomma pulvis-pyrius CBS 109.77]|uniref:Uncharacterized protein n=1 Tax=Melanomma pulvis-pyrius CBS 109.77 TaxID=1314802 RepID=A0A6A6WZ37_9PLEO|nr:hypothetical protein K505DRAFT_253255 [Melanomma pulvis-pyrius CBS 109.77]